MTREGRKKAGAAPPRSAWETMLEKATGPDPTQAGEVEPEMEAEPRGGGDKGRDTETGAGGYGGDAVVEGNEEALSEPERPLDTELNDPRTHAGEGYPSGVSAGEAIENPGDGRTPGDVGGIDLDERADRRDTPEDEGGRHRKSPRGAGARKSRRNPTRRTA